MFTISKTSNLDHENIKHINNVNMFLEMMTNFEEDHRFGEE
jgi:hypothetical protein